MGLPDTPPLTSVLTIKPGDQGWGAWAVQRFLNSVLSQTKLTEDGDFGPATKSAVEHYQHAVGLTADGIVGPKTQGRGVRSAVVRSPYGANIPRGVVEGLIAGESGGYWAAANSRVPGGVDLGLTQKRVLGPPYDQDQVKFALDAVASVGKVAEALYLKSADFRHLAPVKARPDADEYAWRLALLAHNWPWGANQLASGNALPAKRATVNDIIGYHNGRPVYGWIPAGLTFRHWVDGHGDGAPVITYADWAEFYAMGSKAHGWEGSVASKAFGIPTY